MGNSQSKPVSPRTKAVAPEIIPSPRLSEKLATDQNFPSAVDHSQNVLRPTKIASMRLNDTIFGPEIITSNVVSANYQSDDKTKDNNQNVQTEKLEELEDWVHVMPFSQKRDIQLEANSIKLGSPIQFPENSRLFHGRRRERKGAVRRNLIQRRQTRKFKSQLQLEEEESGYEFMSPFTLMNDRGHASRMKSEIDSRTRF
ncbi:hypothetical protein EYC84_002105 [Monilinia fructicola]|uniref:Uncharacterized protein n=1 Tax=Monilinia fructicola TaxID=38448 RepID=A0A5M9JU34_MONFR|nr:hypothetical protein EYC84_002105 [Monilinia fructicola]